VGRDLPWAWLRQAGSDLAAAKLCYIPTDEQTSCHAVAKHQQAVEKSIKGIVAGLNDTGVLKVHTGFNHDVERLVSALVHLPHAAGNKDIQNRINGLLNEHHRSEIRAICALAPKRPIAGELARRNTEYPYQNQDATWRAPADKESFGPKDAERFRRIAHNLYEGASRVVSAMYR
jgi:HEPN domain-containing protein